MAAASAAIQTFLEYSATIFFPSHWLLFDINVVETTDSGERGIDPVEMTIINSRKEYWPNRVSNQRPLYSALTFSQKTKFRLFQNKKKSLQMTISKLLKTEETSKNG